MSEFQPPDGLTTEEAAELANVLPPTLEEAYAEGRKDEREELSKERDIAIAMLAAWCIAVDVNGTGWDDWDEHYKDAMYRPGPLRGLLDKAIADARAMHSAGRQD